MRLTHGNFVGLDQVEASQAAVRDAQEPANCDSVASVWSPERCHSVPLLLLLRSRRSGCPVRGRRGATGAPSLPTSSRCSHQPSRSLPSLAGKLAARRVMFGDGPSSGCVHRRREHGAVARHLRRTTDAASGHTQAVRSQACRDPHLQDAGVTASGRPASPSCQCVGRTTRCRNPRSPAWDASESRSDEPLWSGDPSSKGRGRDDFAGPRPCAPRAWGPENPRRESPVKNVSRRKRTPPVALLMATQRDRRLLRPSAVLLPHRQCMGIEGPRSGSGARCCVRPSRAWAAGPDRSCGGCCARRHHHIADVLGSSAEGQRRVARSRKRNRSCAAGIQSRMWSCPAQRIDNLTGIDSESAHFFAQSSWRIDQGRSRLGPGAMARLPHRLRTIERWRRRWAGPKWDLSQFSADANRSLRLR